MADKKQAKNQKNPDAKPAMLSPRQVAQQLNCHIDTARRIIKKAAAHGATVYQFGDNSGKRGRSMIRINAADFERYQQQQCRI